MVQSKTNLMGVPVACVDKQGLLGAVSTWMQAESGASRPVRLVTYMNAHCFNLVFSDTEYRQNLQKFDLIYADGVGAVLAGRLLGGCRLTKLTGADWIYDLCDLAQRRRWNLFIVAGKPGIAARARTNLCELYPDLVISGAYDGHFIEKSERQLLDSIRRQAPDLLLLGMSVPLQENWSASLRCELPVRICWAVGALFDYVAGKEPRAPGWMRAVALEWLWRLLVNPAGKWNRYLIGNPVFLYRLLRHWVLYASPEKKGSRSNGSS